MTESQHERTVQFQHDCRHITASVFLSKGQNKVNDYRQYDRQALCHIQRCRPASRQQKSYNERPITIESINKQRLMSGRKIVGSAAERLISILYCESLWAVSRSPPTTA